MRILVNGLSARVGGGQTVLKSHIAALAASSINYEITLVTTDKVQATELDGVHRIVTWPKMPTPARVFLEQLAIPILAAQHRADMIYCIGNMGLLVPRRPVAQLLQSPHHFASLAPSERSSLYTRRRRLRYWVESRLARASARRSTIVCSVSGTLAAAIRCEWPEVAARVRVIQNSLPDDPPAADPGLRLSPYCLFVANDYPHKHWSEIVEVFTANHDLPPLIVVGQPGRDRPVQVTEIGQLDSGLDTDRTVFLGSITDRALLVWLYETASVVLVHSTSETFGITVLEALQHNGRVAVSDLPAHREVAAERSACFYEATDTRAMVTAVRQAVHQHPSQMGDGPAAAKARLAGALERVFEEVMISASGSEG